MTNRQRFRETVLLIIDTLPESTPLAFTVHGGDTRTTLHLHADGTIDETGYDVRWMSMTYGGRDFPAAAGPAYIAESVMRSAATKSTRAKIDQMVLADAVAQQGAPAHARYDGRQS